MPYCYNPSCPQPQNSDTAQRCRSCGWGLLLQSRYFCYKLIGQGGLGRTFIATDTFTSHRDSTRIIKQLFPLAKGSSPLIKTKVLFQQTAQGLKELGQNPHIPELCDYFQQRSSFYLVQEWINGPSLAHVLAEQGVFQEAQIWEVLKSVLPTLEFIHDRQVIHGDIKPDNLIRHRIERRLYLVDFGAVSSVAALEGLKVGSPEYVAPEQARGKAVFASDLYSLGVTCIHLLTNIPAFNLVDTLDNRWWRQFLTEEISDDLGRVLDKLVQTSLSQRFQTAAEVLQSMGKSQVLTLNPPIATPSAMSWECEHTLTVGASVNAVNLSLDGQSLASADDEKLIKLWQLSTGMVTYMLAGHLSRVTSLALNPDGQSLASGSDDKTIGLWHLKTGTRQILSGHTHGIKSVAFSPDGQWLASGSGDKTIKLWAVGTGKMLYSLAGHRLHVTAVAFSSDNNGLASASFDRTVRVWGLSTAVDGALSLQLRHKLLGHTWPVVSLAFCPEGKLLATGSDDNTIKLWDLSTGQLIRTLVGHSWSVVSLCFSLDGAVLISGSWDTTIKLWQVETGVLLTTLCGHTDSVTTVTLSSDGKTIASGSKDQRIKIWRPTSMHRRVPQLPG